MKRLLAVVLALAATASLMAAPTAIPGLHRFTMPNGLEVFVLENHRVPLVRLQISFRCGAISQTPETAGLFHLYEHLLFKGNSKYKTETEFSAAMTDLGVAEWNGGTSTEYVTYYFTVPSDKLSEGLEFWSHAVREPLFDEDELTVEKDVVSNEINGSLGDPDHIFLAALDKALFPSYPWRRDVGGHEAVIRSATTATMRNIQNTYYVPNNAALFIAGDVKPDEAYALAERWYGSWKKAADPWKSPLPAHPTPAVKEPVFAVFPDDSLPQGIGYMEMRMRGPDVLADTKATYAADVWGYLLQNPDGRFKKAVYENVPKLYDKDYTSGSYYTQRDGGSITFATYIFTDAAGAPLADRAKVQFRKAIKEVEIPAMVSDPAYFSDHEFSVVKARLEDDQILTLDDPEKYVEQLSFWWASASTDYYLGYVPAMKKVSKADIGAFLTRYVSQNVELVSLRINPADFEAEKASLQAAGFTVISPENAYWWRKN